MCVLLLPGRLCLLKKAGMQVLQGAVVLRAGTEETRVMLVAVKMPVMTRTGGLPNGKAAWSSKNLMIAVSITSHQLLQIARGASCWGNIRQQTAKWKEWAVKSFWKVTTCLWLPLTVTLFLHITSLSLFGLLDSVCPVTQCHSPEDSDICLCLAVTFLKRVSK